ncbi:MAG: hypothetical protein PVF27_04600 [Gemmatimonadales bacterium]|jgi:hypothetical protein
MAAQQPDSVRIERLERQVEAITRQLEALQLGEDVVAAADTGVYGFAPGASKVYRAPRGVSIGGYGEVLFEGYAAERQDGSAANVPSQLDALRAIVYVGYKFSDRILFNSEIEIEHGSTGQAGSVSLEFGYIDYFFSDAVGARAGMLLVPMGFVNEQHEPPTFLGTERPETERRIIPSTWRENGVGVFGSIGDVSARAYVINGFDGIGGGTSGAGGFSASGLRGGRQKGSKAMAEDFAGVARVDYDGVSGVALGTSLYYGQSGQNEQSPTDPGAAIGGETLIWEGHAEYRAHGFDVRGLFALATVADAADINELRGLSGNASVGERLVGWYGQLGYDILWRTSSQHQLIPYVRYEALDTQNRVPAGYARNPANDRTILTFGVAWKPLPQLVAKMDYGIHRNGADTGLNQLNVATGYLF